MSLSLMFSNQNFVGIAYPSCLLHNLPITSSLLYYLGEEYNLQSFLLCTLLQPSITCNMLGSIVFFALFSRHLQSVFFSFCSYFLWDCNFDLLLSFLVVIFELFHIFKEFIRHFLFQLIFFKISIKQLIN